MAFSNQLQWAIDNPSHRIKEFMRLLEPIDPHSLETMALKSRQITRQKFGKAMRLFAPLYLSNECINSCAYCGFSRENSILRVTLEIDEMMKEARHLASQGFRNILLVAGEHPKYVSDRYLERCIKALSPEFPEVSLEVAPMETEDYIPLVQAGAEGLIVYQETYHREEYQKVHLAGPKKNFDWRLDTPERAYAAGFRRLGIGALFGLWDWRDEARALATHLEYLLRECWTSSISVSLPRLRPAAGSFTPTHPLGDRDFVQLLCALRITFPSVGIVLSTRETAAFRDAVVSLGITTMSAGSHTEPGGYTGQGKEHLHHTVRGKQIKIDAQDESATAQFDISDERSPEDVAKKLRKLGLDPVWKDWDTAILMS